MEVDLQLPLWQWALIFAAGGAVLVRAGVTLAESGDEIAHYTGIGRLLVGSLLVAGATSLPELLTDVSASLVGAPDIAVGDLFGSSMANMAILGVIDLMHRGRVWPSVELGHARVAAIGIVLTAVAVLGVLAPSPFSVGWVGWHTIAIVAFYVAIVAWMRRSPSRRHDPAEPAVLPTVAVAASEVAPEEPAAPDGPSAPEPSPSPVRRAVIRFSVSTVAIGAAAPVVAVSGQGIARESGLAETFVGVLLVAISTSLPELVASLAALRIGAYDLAVGNLYGSNAVNMTVMLFADLAYTDGPILSAVAPSQAVAGIGAIILMALSLAAIVHGQETRIRRVEPDAALVLGAYVLLLAAVYATSA